MADYDLSRLSPRSFEQLVQAIAAVVIGPGIVAFGDGPDGGREAVFDSRIPYPHDTDPWHGYGVVQAKYRQRAEGTGKDADWALQELKKELDKFADPERKLLKPEYYIFATNVVLSPVAEKGAKDKAATLFARYNTRVPIKGFRLWDYDQLRTFLDNREDIRHAYTAWITPGDVLAEVINRIKRQRPDFQEVMTNLLQKELLADQYVNLGQAGHATDEKTPLARVFVDLPIDSGLQAQPRRKDEKKQSEPGAIQELLRLGAQRLDPASNPTSAQRLTAVGDGAEAAAPGRVVLIGGPGQGKSTLAQFLCQLHRAALLGDYKGAMLLPEVRHALTLIWQQCKAEELSLPAVPRFPFRVELSQFASALANKQIVSLFVYVLEHIRKRTTRNLSADDLRAWLQAYPWLVVLDGLDEVPASSNRREVLDAVQDFLVDATGCNADLLLLATSRPQGYNDDFSPRYYFHRTLTPLDVERALHYARRLANERWGVDPDKMERVMGRLNRAAQEEATARLMRSPLQVTIMTVLVETTGQPPKERWRLFNDYYQVIYRREKERPICTAELLNSYQADIDVIHQRVGQRLQAYSERSGGTKAILSHDQFADLVQDRLKEEGHEGQELETLQKSIIDAALECLVFLVAPREGFIGFEIRSLQEFMAAQYLMNGSDEEVSRRLRAIAPAAHWRNVFLFAAGRCFHERQHLRDTLYALCGELNEGEGVSGSDEVEKAILAGSRLALEILEDGAVARQPGQLKLYVRLALRLMVLPPCGEQDRLARQYSDLSEKIYREEIERYLGDGVKERRLGAWRVLINLVGRGVAWAEAMAEEHWPQDPYAALDILTVTEEVDGGEWHFGRWLEVIPQVRPASLQQVRFDFQEGPVVIRTYHGIYPTWLELLLDTEYRMRGDIALHLEGVDGSGFRFFLQGSISSDIRLSDLAEMPNPCWEWRWLAEVERFRREPSKEGLAELLEHASSQDNSDWWNRFGHFASQLPWPLMECLEASQDGDTLQTLAADTAAGKLGDFPDWVAGERRWLEQGLTEADFLYVPESGLPFDRRIAEIGFPFRGSGSNVEGGRVSAISGLLNFWRRLSASSTRAKIADDLVLLLSIAGEQRLQCPDLVPGELHKILDDRGERSWMDTSVLGALPDVFWTDSEGISVLDTLGETRSLSFRPFHETVENFADIGYRLESLLIRFPTYGGILRLLASLCVAGYRPQLPTLHIDLSTFDNPCHRTAALLLSIAQKSWTAGKAASFRAETADLAAQQPEVIKQVLRLLRSQEMSGRPVETFLVALYSGLSSQNWRARQEVTQALVEAQRQHLSGLANV